VRHPDQDLTGYDLVVAPAIQLMGSGRARHLSAVARDALLLVGPRTGYRTPAGRVHEDGQPGPLANLLGCKLKDFDSMRPGLETHVGSHRVEIWAESYAPRGGEVTHTYADGPLAGEAAVIRHGNAVTVGAWSPSLIGEVVAGLLEERGIPHERLPEGVRVARRGNQETWMNFNQAPVTLPDGGLLGPVAFEVRAN
jgi:beta-galactosidase